MNATKLFTASIVVLALALGFCLGTLYGQGGTCCNGSEISCCKKGGMPCEHDAMNAPDAPRLHGDRHREEHRAQGDFGKAPDFKHRASPAFIDSILQVMPEQKAKLEENRTRGDSLFKEIRAQKHEAEKALGAALESGDADSIEAAKAKVLEADKAMLEHRINGVAGLANILTKEQLDKFNRFNREQMKKFKDRMRDGHQGPRKDPHDGPRGDRHPAPPQK